MPDAATQPEREEQRPEVLVIQGAGAKGGVSVGVIKEMEEAGMLDGIKQVYGSSSGGIVAFLVGMGMNADQIKQQMDDLDFTLLMDRELFLSEVVLGKKAHNIFAAKNPAELLASDVPASLMAIAKSKGHGLYKGEYFSDFIKNIIAARTGNPELTFKQLHDLATNPKNPGYDPRLKDIVLTGTAIGEHHDVSYFRWDDPKFENMPIWKAVRITMSFPGAFEAVECNGKLYVDGGLQDNFAYKSAMDGLRKPGEHHLRTTPEGGTLGIAICSKEDLDFLSGESAKSEDKVGLVTFVQRLAGAAGIGAANPDVLKKHLPNIATPSDLGKSTLDFNMSKEDKKALFEEGRRAAKERFGTRKDWKEHQKYHRERDILDILKSWEYYIHLKKATDQKSIEEREKIEAKYGAYFEAIKHLEDRDAQNPEVKEALENKFEELDKQRKEAIEKAKKRQEDNREALDLALSGERLKIVGEIIQAYDGASTLIETYKNTSQESDAVVAKFDSLNIDDDKIRSGIDLLNKHLSELRKDKPHTTNMKSFQKELRAIGLKSDAEISAFYTALKLYDNYTKTSKDKLDVDKELKVPPSKKEMLEHLKKHSEILVTETKKLEVELNKLEDSCYENGMSILYPDPGKKPLEKESGDEKYRKIDKLKSKFSAAKKKYFETGGEVATRAIAVKSYIDTFKHIGNIKNDIDRYMNLAVKFSDFLQEKSKPLYKCFDFVATRLPDIFSPIPLASNYNRVIRMRQNRAQLINLRDKLGKDGINISRYGEVPQRYFEVLKGYTDELQKIEEKRKDGNLTRKENIELTKRLDKIHEEINKTLKQLYENKDFKEKALMSDVGPATQLAPTLKVVSSS